MVSQTTAIFLAAVFVSAYGLPADTTLVAAPAVVGGGYAQAGAPAVPVAAKHIAGAAPRADYAPDAVHVDYGYGQDVDAVDRRRRRSPGGRRGDRRGRSRTRRYSDDSECSDADSDRSDRSRSRHSSLDSYRSRDYRSGSCDSNSGRSVSRGSRSRSCDSRSDRSVSRGSRSRSCDSRCSRDSRRGRRGRGRGIRRWGHGRRWGQGRRHHGFWTPRPYGPAPWGPRPYGPRPWGVRPYGPRPMGPRPWRPIRPRPIRPRPIRPRPYGSDNDSECASPLQKRFFDDRSGVDRVSGLPRIYGGGHPAQQGRRSQDQHRGGNDYNRGDDRYGVDAYGQGRRAGGYGRDDYGADEDYYGGRDYGRDDYENDYGQDDYGYGGRPSPRSRGGYPIRGRPTLNVDRQFSQNDYDANVNQRTVNVNDRRNGRFSLDERHADEESFDRSGRERIMVDRFGQRVTSRQEEIDAARREADSRNVRISGPNGSLNHSRQSGSEDLFSSDRHERTFNGPNRQASERSFSTSTSSRDFSSESTRTVGRPSFRN